MALPPKEISFLIQDILLLQVIVLQFLLVFLGEVKLLKDEVIDASRLFFHLIEGGFQPVSPDTGNHLDGTDDDLVPDMADVSQIMFSVFSLGLGVLVGSEVVLDDGFSIDTKRQKKDGSCKSGAVFPVGTVEEDGSFFVFSCRGGGTLHNALLRRA